MEAWRRPRVPDGVIVQLLQLRPHEAVDVVAGAATGVRRRRRPVSAAESNTLQTANFLREAGHDRRLARDRPGVDQPVRINAGVTLSLDENCERFVTLWVVPSE